MRKNGFVEKTIAASVSLIQNSVFSEQIAMKNGLLQKLDARIKIVSFLLLVICILFVKDIRLVLVMYLFCLMLSGMSRISYAFFLERTLFFIPAFSFFIALPSIFAIITPGETAFKIAGIAVTKPGLLSATLLVSRVTTSVSFVVLLSLTTHHFELLNAMEKLGIPSIFVMTAGMCYRYIYLFAEIVGNTFIAIKSRSAGFINVKQGQKITAWNMAMLWNRSFILNEQVYHAMLSRGYIGESVSLGKFKMRIEDFLWLLIIIVLILLIFLLDYLRT